VIDPVPVGAVKARETDDELALVCDSDVGAAGVVSAEAEPDAAEVFQAFTPFRARRYTVYAVLAVSPDTVNAPPAGVTALQVVPFVDASYVKLAAPLGAV
jgi:hypothetical protein